jgi:hypothetical protein
MATKNLYFGYDRWIEDDWVSNSTKKMLRYNNQTYQGTVTVKSKGLYFIYASMTFHSLLQATGYYIDITNINTKKGTYFYIAPIECLQTGKLYKNVTSYDIKTHEVYKQCLVSFVWYLEKDYRVSLRHSFFPQLVVADPKLTYWGIVKL